MPACWEMLLAPEVLWPWMRAAAFTAQAGPARYPSLQPVQPVKTLSQSVDQHGTLPACC